MPEQDGIGTILQIMKNPERPAIIAISGGSPGVNTPFIQSIAHKLPIEAFLIKPISFEVLAAAIDKALSSLAGADT
jgi:response regulator of citrate/malate metabolism